MLELVRRVQRNRYRVVVGSVASCDITSCGVAVSFGVARTCRLLVIVGNFQIVGVLRSSLSRNISADRVCRTGASVHV